MRDQERDQVRVMRGCKGVRYSIVMLGMMMIVYTGRFTIFEQGYMASRERIPLYDYTRDNKITRISAGYSLG